MTTLSMGRKLLMYFTRPDKLTNKNMMKLKSTWYGENNIAIFKT